MCDLLKARGLVAPRRRRAPAAPRAVAPGADHAPRTTRGRRISKANFARAMALLLSADAARRLQPVRAALRRAGRAAPTTATRRRFERAFAEYGLPERIRSDNGRPVCEHRPRRGCRGCRSGGCAWASSRSASRSGHPEQNGSHEQFHSVLKAETARPPAAHARGPTTPLRSLLCRIQPRAARMKRLQRRRAGELLSALAARRCRAQLPPLEYPGHCEIRRVSHDRPGLVARRAAVSVAKRSPANTSPSKKSTTASGRCALPPSRWRGTTNVIARFTRLPRCPRRGAPPAALAPRLT